MLSDRFNCCDCFVRNDGGQGHEFRQYISLYDAVPARRLWFDGRRGLWRRLHVHFVKLLPCSEEDPDLASVQLQIFLEITALLPPDIKPDMIPDDIRTLSEMSTANGADHERC